MLRVIEFVVMVLRSGGKGALIVFATAMLELGLAQVPPGHGCYSWTGGLTYTGGVVQTSNTKVGACCQHCCRQHQPGPGAAHAWSWIANKSSDDLGTCLCQDRHKITGEKNTKTGMDKAGICINHPGDLPWVPADLDTKKWVTTGDDRTLIQRPKEQIHYACTYPNDPTTIADIKREARAAADYPNGASTFVKCDTCKDAGLDGTIGNFCVRPETYAKTGNFSVLIEPYQVNYCSEVKKFEKPRVYVYKLGVENGTYFLGGSEACSPQQPPQTCQSLSNRWRHCNCDPIKCTDKNGNTDCCRWVGNETMSARYTYFTLNGSVVVQKNQQQ